MPDPRDDRYENYRYDEEAEMQEWKEWAESWLEGYDETGGAGEEGTDDLVDRYKRDTPGQ